MSSYHVLSCDYLIVGAGIIGSALALKLSEKGAKNILVVDLDLEGRFSSSELNAGGVRATWFNKNNAEISKYSIRFYETLGESVGFRQKGYFWLYSSKNFEASKKQLQSNEALFDWEIQFFEKEEILKQYPFLNKLDGVSGASFSKYDGLINPNLLKLYYRKKAIDFGVQFLDRLLVFDCQPRLQGYECLSYEIKKDLDEEGLKKLILSHEFKDEKKLISKEIKIECKNLINATGAWAKKFNKIIGAKNYSYPLKRQICLFEAKGLDLSNFGMFIDTSGVYFHAEAKYILSGFALNSEQEGYNLDYDGESFFEQYIWSSLYERSTYFEELKHITGWAGLYEVSPDHSAIIGRVSDLENVFECHSFSGRGVMQSYGAAEGLSDLILFNQYKKIDLSKFSSKRFEVGEVSLLSENLII